MAEAMPGPGRAEQDCANSASIIELLTGSVVGSVISQEDEITETELADAELMAGSVNALPLLLKIREAAQAVDGEVAKSAGLRNGPVLVPARKFAKLRAALAALEEGE